MRGRKESDRERGSGIGNNIMRALYSYYTEIENGC
jgi:hypothetical protein